MTSINDPDFIRYKKAILKQQENLKEVVKACKLLQSQHRGVDIIFDCRSKRNGAKINSLIKLDSFKKK
jgi:hypothetical protein